MPRVINAFKQFFSFNSSTGNLEPLVDGWLKFLVSGTNNTDKDTFADVDETIANTNPVQLDAEGRCPNIFGTGSYRVISYTNDPILSQPSVQIEQFDPVPGGLESSGQFSQWFATVEYIKYDIVTGSDGLYYQSQVTDNIGNDPTTDDGTNWERTLNTTEIIQDLGTLIGGTQDIDTSLGDKVLATISTATQTFTFTSTISFILFLTNGGSQTVNFPATVIWPGGAAPTYTVSGTDSFVFIPVGSVWYGYIMGLDSK